MRTINIGGYEGECHVLTSEMDLDVFKELTDKAHVITPEERNIRNQSRFTSSQTSFSIDELESQSEQMITRRRFGPAIRCLCLGLDKLHSEQPIYKMENPKLVRLIKLYSRRAFCNLQIAQNSSMTRSVDKKRFLEKVIEDCNFVLHIGIFKKELLDSEQEVHSKFVEVESKATQLISSLILPAEQAQTSGGVGGRGPTRRIRRNRTDKMEPIPPEYISIVLYRF